MLEQNDLQAIAMLIRQSQTELEKSMDAKLFNLESSMDEKLHNLESSMDEKLHNLESSMDEKLHNLEASMNQRIDKLDRRMTTLSKRVTRNYRTLNKKIDDRTEFLLEEIDRVVGHKLDRIMQNLQVLNESYAVQQIAHKNMELMAAQLHDLNIRVERLEAKTA